ncbi:MAG: ATP-binding protein, partial [Pseudomonadota bacterium]
NLLAYISISLLLFDAPKVAAALGNTLGAALGALLLSRKLREPGIAPVGDLRWTLIAAAPLSAAISVLCGGTELLLRLQLPLSEAPEIALRWFLSCYAGAVVVVPPLLAWQRTGGHDLPDFGSHDVIVGTAACVFMFASMDVELAAISTEGLLILISLPAILWLAMRPPTAEAVLGLSLTGGGCLTFAAIAQSDSGQGLLETQLFALSLLMSAALLQAATGHRVALVEGLTNTAASLEGRVMERTQAAHAATANAEAAARSQSALLAATRHEVHASLEAILGVTASLQDSARTPNQQQQIETIQSASTGIMSLLNDAADLARIEAGELPIERRPQRLDEVLDQLARRWRPLAIEKGLSFEIHSRDTVPRFLTLDAPRLLQCLSNLVANAIRCTTSGRVTVRVNALAQEGEQVRVEFAVTDTGPGMDAAEQARRLQPISEAAAGGSDDLEVSSLGLSLTQRLANLMGGGVSVHSERGQGATFALEISATRVDVSALLRAD